MILVEFVVRFRKFWTELTIIIKLKNYRVRSCLDRCGLFRTVLDPELVGCGLFCVVLTNRIPRPASFGRFLKTKEFAMKHAILEVWWNLVFFIYRCELFDFSSIFDLVKSWTIRCVLLRFEVESNCYMWYTLCGRVWLAFEWRFKTLKSRKLERDRFVEGEGPPQQSGKTCSESTTDICWVLNKPSKEKKVVRRSVVSETSLSARMDHFWLLDRFWLHQTQQQLTFCYQCACCMNT